MSTERKSLNATIQGLSDVSDDKPYGGFLAVASDQSLDRDGEVLPRDEWLPLPARITVDTDHGMNVATTIGSARPYFDGDNLMIDAAFSSIGRAQEVRTLIREGHISTVSVATLVDREKDPHTPRRELLNVGVVAVPANRNAVILDAKGVKAKAFSDAVDVIVKSGGGETALLQAIHDASAHLGAECLKGYGSSEDQFDDGDDGDDYDASGTDDGANKSLALLRLRVKALALSG